MNSPTEFDRADDARLDRATADRLGRLRGLPVDTSRLDRLIQAELPRQAGATRPRFTIFRLRPVRAVAASLLLLTGLAAVLLLTASGGPVLASPAQMAQMHEDLVAGRVPVMWADSVESANRMLASKSPESPEFPGVPTSLPADHVMACCMRSVKDKKVACLLLKTDGVPVTLTVANAADMALPKSPTVSRGGVTYHQQSSGRLNMIMTERNRRWVCLIGDLPAERLMDLADQLRF